MILKNFSKVFKMSIASIFIASMFFIIPMYQANAYTMPDVSIKEIDINSATSSFKSGETIGGEFAILNNSDAIVTDLSYRISIYSKREGSINEIDSKVAGQIYPKKSLNQSFSYIVPKNINSGDYKLVVQLFSKAGQSVSKTEKDIKIFGNEKYLYIKADAVLKEKLKESKDSEENIIENEYPPLSGINFLPSENNPKITFSIHNRTSDKISYKPKIKIYWFESNLKEVENMANLEERFAEPNENRSDLVVLPKYDKAGSYLAKLTLFSDNLPVSNTESFRWVVKGEMARILSVSLDKDAYAKGDMVNISVDLIGPPDSSDAGQGTLVVTVYDRQGKILAQEEKATDLNTKDKKVIVSFLANTVIIDPVVEAKIIKGQKEFDNYKTDIKSSSESIKRIGSIPSANNNYKALIYVFIIIIILTILLILNKFKKDKKIFFLLFLFVLGFLSINIYDAKASITDAWISPTPGATFNLGANIDFRGTVTLSGCANSDLSSYVESYICDKNKANCIPASAANNISATSFSKDTIVDNVHKKLYIVDDVGHRIMQIDIATKKIEKVLGTPGSGAGEFFQPFGGSYDEVNNYLYIADKKNDRIVRFKPDDPNWNKAYPAGSWETMGSYGGSDGKFKKPYTVFYDSVSKYLYVSDKDNQRIVRFKPGNSAPLDPKWNKNIFGGGTWEEFGGGGTGDGEFNRPLGIFYDSGSGYLYITDGYQGIDTAVSRVVRFKPDDPKWNKRSFDGGSWKTYGSYGTGTGKFDFKDSADVLYSASASELYVADKENDRIVRFNPDSSNWNKTPGNGGSWEIMNAALGIDYSSPTSLNLETGTNTIYVSDSHNYRVVSFPLSAWSASSLIYDFLISGRDFEYLINGKIPDTVADFGGSFAFGAGGKVYAKARIKIHDNQDADILSDDVDESQDFFEEIFINVLPPSPSGCGGATTLFDPRDGGQTYDIVEIGTQCWMAENLNVGNRIDAKTGGAPKTQKYNSGTGLIEKYCRDDSNAKCATYGGYYQWHEAVGLPQNCDNIDCSAQINSYPWQGICPAGWHIPSDVQLDGQPNDWSVLETFLTTSGVCDPNRDDLWSCNEAGKKMKAGGSSGFNVGMYGSVGYDGEWMHLGNDTHFWTASASPYTGSILAPSAWGRDLDDNNDDISREGKEKKRGMSVRCVKDNVSGNTLPAVNNLSIFTPNYCEESPNSLNLSWQFQDLEDLDVQTKYQLRITRTGSGPAMNYDSGIVTSANTSIFAAAINSQSNCSGSCAGFIDYSNSGSNYVYTWSIMVWDSAGASDGPETGTFSTPLHQYPLVRFAPPPPANASIVNLPTQFKAKGNTDINYDSVCYGSGAPCKTYDWDFCFSGAACPLADRYATGEAPTHTYVTQDDFGIVLTVTDKDGYVCSNASAPKMITAKTAKWKEVIPR